MRLALEKFMKKFENLDTANYEMVERILIELSVKELELIQRSILHTKEVDMTAAVRRTIQSVAKKTLADKSLSKTEKSFAITDTTKYCKIFYRAPNCELTRM